ncbi:hypothetical protein BDV35DRAFT_384956 [Aspergillus flavus]|uniref:Uncharacterized protein n=1 Tax=Aspergillus flavus TaxID=5059 RepID=A0A5N6GGE0_ASPFL|nr:hypothetical protein BDV35DRAFT_384956 [Aspergillus flavus]
MYLYKAEGKKKKERKGKEKKKKKEKEEEETKKKKKGEAARDSKPDQVRAREESAAGTHVLDPRQVTAVEYPHLYYIHLTGT